MRLADCSTYWKRGNASYDRVNELLHEKTHIVEQLGAVQTPAKGELNVAISSFNYPKEESPALEQIKFAIQEGETLGIVGKTGVENDNHQITDA